MTNVEKAEKVRKVLSEVGCIAMVETLCSQFREKADAFFDDDHFAESERYKTCHDLLDVMRKILRYR